jgi:hypothetical protein
MTQQQTAALSQAKTIADYYKSTQLQQLGQMNQMGTSRRLGNYDSFPNQLSGLPGLHPPSLGQVTCYTNAAALLKENL